MTHGAVYLWRFCTSSLTVSPNAPGIIAITPGFLIEIYPRRGCNGAYVRLFREEEREIPVEEKWYTGNGNSLAQRDDNAWLVKPKEARNSNVNVKWVETASVNFYKRQTNFRRNSPAYISDRNS